MPRKKSVRKTAERFIETVDELDEYCEAVGDSEFSDAQVSLAYEGATIRLYSAFEDLILGALIGAINNDTAVLTETAGVDFPRHLTDEVCEYIIIGNGYFDFRGRSGLIREVKKYVPDDHYLAVVTKKKVYTEAIERLSALRNYAAHGSSASKRVALRVVGQERMGSAGSWIKTQERFTSISGSLKRLAGEIEAEAPY